jgi:hypothetical protein
MFDAFIDGFVPGLTVESFQLDAGRHAASAFVSAYCPASAAPPLSP